MHMNLKMRASKEFSGPTGIPTPRTWGELRDTIRKIQVQFPFAMQAALRRQETSGNSSDENDVGSMHGALCTTLWVEGSRDRKNIKPLPEELQEIAAHMLRLMLIHESSEDEFTNESECECNEEVADECNDEVVDECKEEVEPLAVSKNSQLRILGALQRVYKSLFMW